MNALRHFVASIYSWKLTLILERIYAMSVTLDALSAAVDSLLAKEASASQLVASANAERDKAVAALADVEAKAATDQAALQAQVDAITAKITG